ncbi:MAG TPA: hypothetical protein VKT21_04845 [Thermoplasmata archaeon]|nr:hypothetical protein [Thermoplasmata archaeon]
MVHVEVKPEADSTARRIPREALQAYFDIFVEWERSPRLVLPGSYRTHRLRDTRDLWTLKLTADRGHPWADYRCIYQWTGSEVNVLRFGDWRNVYQHLPRTGNS